jgi:osmotically-inducible protein OsmY
MTMHQRWAAFTVAACLGSGIALGATDNDSRTEAALKKSYAFQHYLKDDDITVKSSNGVVTLKGTVSEDYHKSLAAETASSMPGVTQVDNELSVRADQPEARSDAWITMKVKGALAFHRNVSALATEVTTDNGVVTLAGKAGSEAEKQLATEYAKDVDGVKSVRNQLIVTGHTEPAMDRIGDKIDDASITAQVKTSLLFHRSTRALATKVATRDGVVTIRGRARNSAEKQLVGKLAEDVNGVRKVDNQMRVGNPES